VKFIPAIDLKDNKCVRLLKGKEEDLTVFNEDPVSQAKYFEDNGCKRIHLVDLDGAFGRPDINKKTILSIRKKINIKIELGGGIKNEKDTSYWIDEGIDYLVLGSLAVKNKELVKSIVEKNKNFFYIALDVLDQKIMIRGWQENSQKDINYILKFYEKIPIKGFILTDISRDGMLQGLDIKLINNLAYKTKKNIIVGGGLSSYEDLYKLKEIKNKNKNLEGVIAGKSFYSGKIAVKKALNILGEPCLK
jgi:phosphoribosylformimino-5-aminoimidazole carboxamide ribotide isomerase